MKKTENKRRPEPGDVGRTESKQLIEQRVETAVQMYEILNEPIQAEHHVFKTFAEVGMNFKYPVNVLLIAEKLITELCFFDEVKNDKSVLDDHSDQLAEILLEGHDSMTFSVMMNEMLNRQYSYHCNINGDHGENSDRSHAGLEKEQTAAGNAWKGNKFQTCIQTMTRIIQELSIVFEEGDTSIQASSMIFKFVVIELELMALLRKYEKYIMNFKTEVCCNDSCSNGHEYTSLPF